MTGDRTSNRHTNRLARESSPYLLQHAHNPVDWFAWGEEAFAEARRRDVPIFLSIGYSTCYWCHVMERESFENADVAAIMNERFVCVKLDREERPAVDELYMAATTITTGHGGWPMSVFLEPHSLRPIYCGTYFPAKSMPGLTGRPTFPQVLTSISDLWHSKRDEVMAQAQQVADAVAEQVAGDSDAASIGRAQVADAASVLLRIFDSVEGGFSRAPKFPQPVFLEFLLDVRAVMDAQTRATVDHALRLTLDAMARGGIFDQVGGGFHRYSVDAHWIVPHFEKMLYDQAQLAAVYTRASRELDDPFYARIARRTLDFVLREMTHASGGFFSAIDAEVDAREGLNYLWQAPDFDAALASGEDANFAREVYGVHAGPNFKDPHHHSEPARSVLRLAGRPEKIAERMGLTPEAFGARIADINARLLAFRSTRPQPSMDDKVLSAWNGLMIGAFAQAGVTLDEPRYTEAARRAMAFVLDSMREEGRLVRSWRGRRGESFAVLEDYAGVLHALAALARADQANAAEYLTHATTLSKITRHDFGDETGALSDAPTRSTDLFARLRSAHDGATPSAASLLLHAWLDLASLSGDGAYTHDAKRLLASLSGKIAQSPISTINSTRALLRLLLAGEVPPGEAHAAGDGAPPASRDEFTPVEVYADVDRVAVSADVPGSLKLFVRIAQGYHVVAADPGAGGEVRGMAPFRVGIVHGKGVVAYADYPAGTLSGVPGAGQIRVYEGEFELPIVIDVEGEWSGTPLLCVSYQACTDTECLRPRIAEIDVAIDRG